MRVAIVQDHLVQRGGAERVLLSMAAAFPGAPVHTAFYRPDEVDARIHALDVRPLPIDRALGGRLRLRHRAALPLLPRAFDHLRVDADVTLCATSGWAAGCHASGRKIAYHHALARWVHEPGAYGRAGRALTPVSAWLARWDRRAVASVDVHVAPSRGIADALGAAFGVSAEVLAPPVTLAVDGPERRPDALPASLTDGFVLCVCRLLPYKRIDVVLAAAAAAGRPVVVAGGGPSAAALGAAAGPDAFMLGPQDDDALRWLYRRAAVLASAADEPFGLVSVEAASFGVPAIVLGRGGFLDTVVDGVTGTHVSAPTIDAFTEALTELPHVDPDALRRHAGRWGEPAFVERLRAIVG